MATLPCSTTTTTALDSSTIFLQSYSSFWSSSSPPPPSSFILPPDLPQSKLIPKTRFIIDAFRYSGPHSLTYFLSHFHSDHYVGLNPNWSKGLIFCSPTTSRLLIQSLKLSPLFVIPIALRQPVLIDACEVTLVDANHCPGAVQFLFRIPRVGVGVGGKDERYVHTGDFRFCNSMKSDPLLAQFVGADAVFLDTTYCNPKFVFPSQDESVNYIVDTIQRIKAEHKRVLFLIATYVVGKEKILLQISKRCGCLIHVDSRKMSILGVLGFGDGAVFTEDAALSDVHVVGWNVLGETWPYFRPNFTKIKDIMVERGYEKAVGFVPTGWMYETKRDGFAVRTKDSLEIHLVPYSEHSSYDELREYVRYLRPKQVIPTVGMDIEKLDSKHADAMQKHFAGLVDEMANKQEFLMGFHRKSRGTDVKDEDDSNIVLNKGVDKEKELESLENLSDKTELVSVLGKTLAKPELRSQKLNVIKNEDIEVMITELRGCLPIWVTQDQMLDLLARSGGDIVEAASEFYEHEPEFRKQVPACTTSITISQISLKSSDSAALLEVTPHGSMTSTSSPYKNPTNMMHSLKNTASPKNTSSKKRGAGIGNMAKKKQKTNSALESSGSKQSTITKFFTKLVPNTSQVGGSDIATAAEGSKNGNITKFFKKLVPDMSPVSGSDIATPAEDPKNGNNLQLNDATKLTEDHLDRFLQVINESVSRSDAASILEKAKGDINMALDIYYSSSSGEHGNESPFGGNLAATQCCAHDNSVANEQKLSDEMIRHRSSLFSQGLQEGNSSETTLLLPLEKYSPSEHACWRSGQPAPYLHLSRTFDLVEGERGKIKATGMLCNMFRSLLALSPEDVLPAVYLCTKKIAPNHKNTELNIGDGLVSAALEEACGANKPKIKELYNTMGDLGDVAQVCRRTQKLLAPPSILTIQEVFSVLRKISLETGHGSTTRKKRLIANLMRSCREKEIKFLVRTLVCNLRIGAMMKTVLPALAQAVLIHSSSKYLHEAPEVLKEKLQGISAAIIEAYNMIPDLDVLVPALLSKGAEFSSLTLSMVPGIPIRPMLARITNGLPEALKLFQGRAFSCEFKYDGQRAQIHKLEDGSLRVYSRNGDETTSRFPDLVNIIKESSNPTAMTFIVDAEVVAIDRKNGCKLMSFQELSSRERGSKNSLVTLNSIKVDICVFIFDIMFANGERLLGIPLRQRRTYLKNLFQNEKPGYFEYAKEITVEAKDASLSSKATLTRINTFFKDAISSSCEGIMVKSLDVDAGYAASKRTDTWLKVKQDYLEEMNDSLDLVPVGAWHGNGRKAGWYSPFLMACYNPDTEEFQSVCRVMSGFSDSFYVEMKEFFSGERILPRKPPYYQTAEEPDFWFSPEVVWEIKAAELTVSPVHHAAIGLVHPSRGVSMRFPRFIRSLSDREVEDCSTAADLADMFQLQTRKMDVKPRG